jgi:hypothetical protein
MKYCLVLLFPLFFIAANAQSVSFSNRTTRLFATDDVIVVPEIGGMNHLLVFSSGEPIRLQVYDDKLEWQEEQKLPFRVKENNDITVLPFSNEYFLYNQSEAGNTAFLWKINASGKAIDQTDKLKNIIKSSFKDSTVLCQLFSNGSSLYVMGNLYFPTLKKIVTTIIETNSNFENPVVKRYAYDYDHTREGLYKIAVVPGRNLIVLKRQVTEDREYILELLKVNLTTSKVYETSFNSATPFSAPDILYNAADSTTTVIAALPRTYYSYNLVRNVFSATVNDTLEQKATPIITKVPIREETYGAFTCINTGASNKWIPVHGAWNFLYNPKTTLRPLVGLSRMVTLQRNTYFINATSYQPRLQPIHPEMQLISEPGDVRFTVVDSRTRRVEDTTIRYHRRNFIEIAQYTSFTKDNNNYLVVKEQFPSKGKGLLLFHLNEQGKLVQLQLHLYERYHYSLPQLQQSAAGNIIMPFVFKSEVGLVSISFLKQSE